jgi:hypothetical protein
MVFGGLFTAIQSFKNRETLPAHKPLCDAVLQVMNAWAEKWGKDKAMKSLFNGNAIYHEMDEYIVPLFNLIAHLEAVEKKKPGVRIALLDIASGKGYLSLLISSLRLHFEALRIVDSITMVDKNKSMNLNHLERIREDGQGHLAPIPITFVQMDLHTKTIEQLIHGLACTPIAIAIHPCKRLSARCVDLFNRLPIAALFLAPCCVPNPSKQPVKCGRRTVVPTVLHASDSPYDAWVDFLASAIECECDKREIVRIRERNLHVEGEVGEVWTKHVGNLCVVAVRTVTAASATAASATAATALAGAATHSTAALTASLVSDPPSVSMQDTKAKRRRKTQREIQ